MRHKEKLGRKVLSFFLSLALVLGMMPQLSLTARAAYSGGSGTADDPYLISTTADWNALADAVNDGVAGNHFEGKYFKMTADIT